MEPISLGILGTSEIAFRRFLPALKKCPHFCYAGVASRDIEKTKKFSDLFGGKGFNGYDDILNDDSIQAVYIPLPPALHFIWAEKALRAGKHVLLEKPFVTQQPQCQTLLDMATSEHLGVHENYMFLYHRQFSKIHEIVDSGILGEVRLVRATFGFPLRAGNDFRYNKNLGGGALLDCGGYPIQLASMLLGDSLCVQASEFLYKDGYNVDMGGSVLLKREDGVTAQVAFGMHHSYKCDVEIWGEKGSIRTARIFTAPPDLSVDLIVTLKDKEEILSLEPDDQFLNSIDVFYRTIVDKNFAAKRRDEIALQSRLMSECAKLAGNTI